MTTRSDKIQVRRVHYNDASDAEALVALLDHYAQDPMGGGQPLTEEAKARLCADLSMRPDAFSFIAWLGGKPVGLINCIEGYSTFKAQPLMNIHDVVVERGHRGQGIAQALLAAAEQLALARGCCKLTLEVLSGNATATRTYEHFGFAPYQLAPEAGNAVMMQKWCSDKPES